MNEESCYILIVPRVKIGLPVCVRFRRRECRRWGRSVVCGSFCFNRLRVKIRRRPR
jgi:hypothetical protein